jgi:hypothetical protein
MQYTNLGVMVQLKDMLIELKASNAKCMDELALNFLDER